jgi:tRNA threonylcarbamoyladenosine biosynthesis protein TsaB
VALASRGRLLADLRLECALRPSETLLPAIKAVLRSAEIPASSLDAVAVTTGPGSFTGLRVGMATVKGLVMGTRIPVQGVSTLQAEAEGIAEAESPAGETVICVLLEAGRGEVYRGVFRKRPGHAGPWVAVLEAPESACPPAEALAGLPEEYLIGGDAAHGNKGIRQSLPRGARLSKPDRGLAAILALRADRISESGRLRDQALLPNYIRLPDALRRGAR